MMYPYGEHMSVWGYALGIIGMVLFWAVLVLAIAAAVRYLDRKRGESFPPPPLPRRAVGCGPRRIYVDDAIALVWPSR
jgi:hypothetical protein